MATVPDQLLVWLLFRFFFFMDSPLSLGFNLTCAMWRCLCLVGHGRMRLAVVSRTGAVVRRAGVPASYSNVLTL